MSPKQGKSKIIGSFVLPTLAVILGMLTACTKVGPEQSLDIYIERLATTLQIEAEVAIARPIPKMPRTSELRVDLLSADLGTLDFLSLSGCAVQITIGKRNSSLGLMASDSQRLLLELEYLEQLPI